VDVFARGALAESWTFAWYPLVVVGMWRTLSRRRLVWYLPAAVAGLVLSHNITALYFLGFCAALAVAALRWHGWRAAGLAALGVALGFGLALWFLIPQQYYMPGVWVSDREFMWTDVAHVYDHRVMPYQFFYSFPRWWFGESHSPQWNDGMSFEIGAAQLLLIPVALAFVRARRNGTARRRGRLVALAWLSIVAWVACIAFMMRPDMFLAVLPPQFTYIQFPWRLLSPAAFFAALGIAVFARAARLPSVARYALVGAGVLSVAIVPAFERTRWTEPGWTDATLVSPSRLYEDSGLGYTVLGEYLPRDFDVEAYREGGVAMATFEKPRVVEGETSIVSWGRNGLDIRATLGPGGGDVVFPLVYYDFYRAEGGDGRRLETFSRDGMLGVRVPAGIESVEITRGLTRVSFVGIAASAAAALATAVCAVAFRRRRAPRGRAASHRAPDPEPEVEPEGALSGRR
jgi:hypothetical protein